MSARARRRADTPAGDLPCARIAGLGWRSDPGRSRLRSSYPTQTEDRIRPTHSVVTAVAVAELHRRHSPVLRVSLLDDPNVPSRQQGSRVTPPSSTPASLPCACSQRSADGIVTAIPTGVRLNLLSFYFPITTHSAPLTSATAGTTGEFETDPKIDRDETAAGWKNRCQ